MKAQPSLALLAFLAAALAASPLAAQKPAEGDKIDPGRRWREQGIALCVAELRAVEGMTPDALEAVCGCAFERFMSGRPAEPLPELGGGRLRSAIGAPILACAFREQPELASAVARWLTNRPPVPTAPQVVPPPPPETAPDKPESATAPEAAGPGFSLRAWWNGLGRPEWLSGLRLWVWLSLGLVLLIPLARLLRRDSSRDLIRPPPHMRRTTVRLGSPPRR